MNAFQQEQKPQEQAFAVNMNDMDVQKKMDFYQKLADFRAVNQAKTVVVAGFK